MAFSSVQFLFVFLPLSLAVYWLCPKWLRNAVLAAFSLLFFAWAGLKGAAWQYVVFGLLHGIILCMERLGLRRALEQLPRLFRHLYTVVLLWLTLVIFGAPSPAGMAGLLVLLFLGLMRVTAGTYSAFIYFQF